MKNFKNSNFIKQLIKSDFIFIGNSNEANTKDMRLTYSTKSLESFSILNVFEINKSLKQLVRSVAFISSKKHYHIYIWVEEKYMYGFLYKLVRQLSPNNCVTISKNFPSKKNNNDYSLVLVFGAPYGSSVKRFSLKAFKKNFLFINKINLKRDKFGLGMYHIQNSLDDYKKLIFLLVLIFQILKK